MKQARAYGMACRKNNSCRPISALDFVDTLANHRPELKLDKSLSQSAVIILSNPVKPFRAPQIFMPDSPPRYFSFQWPPLVEISEI